MKFSCICACVCEKEAYVSMYVFNRISGVPCNKIGVFQKYSRNELSREKIT